MSIQPLKFIILWVSLLWPLIYSTLMISLKFPIMTKRQELSILALDISLYICSFPSILWPLNIATIEHFHSSLQKETFTRIHLSPWTDERHSNVSGFHKRITLPPLILVASEETNLNEVLPHNEVILLISTSLSLNLVTNSRIWISLLPLHNPLTFKCNKFIIIEYIKHLETSMYSRKITKGPWIFSRISSSALQLYHYHHILI